LHRLRLAPFDSTPALARAQILHLATLGAEKPAGGCCTQRRMRRRGTMSRMAGITQAFRDAGSGLLHGVLIGYARARVSVPVMASRRRVDPEASISNRVCEIAARGMHLCRFSERRSPILFVFDFRVHGDLRRWDGRGTTCAHGLSHAAPRSRTDSAWRTRLLVRYRDFELAEGAGTCAGLSAAA
jgi:hypothetical protein